MESNVLSWHVALDHGYEPRLYPYIANDIPVGEYTAMLDFKIWAKKAMAVCCYFTQINTDKKFQLTVFRRQKDKLYMLNEGDVDFKFCDINSQYSITVLLNDNGKIVFKKASFVNSLII